MFCVGYNNILLDSPEPFATDLVQWHWGNHMIVIVPRSWSFEIARRSSHCILSFSFFFFFFYTYSLNLKLINYIPLNFLDIQLSQNKFCILFCTGKVWFIYIGRFLELSLIPLSQLVSTYNSLQDPSTNGEADNCICQKKRSNYDTSNRFGTNTL